MRPDYYKFSIDNTEYQLIDVIDEKELPYHLGTVLCYILRAGKKDPSKYKEDLEKAVEHLQFQLRKMLNKHEDKIVILPHSLFIFNTLANCYQLHPDLTKIGCLIYDHVFLSQETLSKAIVLLKTYLTTL